MDQKYKDATLKDCDILTPYIEGVCPQADVRNVGVGVIIRHRNGGESCVFPITSQLCDLGVKTADGRNLDRSGVAWNDALRVLQHVDRLPPLTAEQSAADRSAATAQPIQSTEGSFYADVKKWWGKDQKFPRGHESSSFNLAEATELAEKLRKIKPTSTKDAPADDDDVESDYHKAMRELAIASDQSADILRNKDLVTLTGLGVAKVSDDGADDDEVSLEEFLESMKPTPSHLEASRTHKGHPVSLTEGRDITKPYANTLNGKVLVDLGFPHGPTLVDKSELPKRKYLSNGPASEGGVHWVESQDQVCYRRPKFRGMA